MIKGEHTSKRFSLQASCSWIHDLQSAFKNRRKILEKLCSWLDLITRSNCGNGPESERFECPAARPLVLGGWVMWLGNCEITPNPAPPKDSQVRTGFYTKLPVHQNIINCPILPGKYIWKIFWRYALLKACGSPKSLLCFPVKEARCQASEFDTKLLESRFNIASHLITRWPKMGS